MDPKQIISVRSRDGILKNEYHCRITDMLDLYQDEFIHNGDPEIKAMMKTYMMTPEDHSGTWYIPIRVPGATRGHIEVKPNGSYWEVATIRLYETTAIIGKSNIGCYMPEVEKILNKFNGNLINFAEFNSKGE